jgi:predicted dehydrogenase
LDNFIKHLVDSRLPILPVKKDFKIGCIGSGFIMKDCQIPAYKSAGFHVSCIASRSKDKAKEVALNHNIPVVYDSIDEMLEHGDFDILDIAVPPEAQPEIIMKALEQSKKLRGILAQKPLAMDLLTAKNLVNACKQKSVTLAVNQNMRFDQSVRVAKSLLNSGKLGDIVLATIEMRAIPHWMPWAKGLKSLSTFIMSIHHLDTFRYWLGNPNLVFASTTKDPRTKFSHTDGVNLYILEYDSGARASSWDDVWAGPAKEGAGEDIYIRWRIEGTLGMAKGTIGWPKYPEKIPSTLEFTTVGDNGKWHSPVWNEVWFPDAFVGTMAQLLRAVELGIEPEISGDDNLLTIALCEAVMISASTHQAVNPSSLIESN